MLLSFPALGKAEQSQAHSKTIGFLSAWLCLLHMTRSLKLLWTVFSQAGGTAPKDGGSGSEGQRGCSLRMGCGALFWLQPLLQPPRAHMLSDREGQLQLACPFPLFLLDLLALDLKLWLLLKLLLKNKFHMYYPSSASDTEWKRNFSVLSCVIWINLQSAWLETQGLCRSLLFFSLWNTILTLRCCWVPMNTELQCHHISFQGSVGANQLKILLRYVVKERPELPSTKLKSESQTRPSKDLFPLIQSLGDQRTCQLFL